MISLAVQQHSPEWQAARLGRPTASRFSDILQPKKLQYSASAGKYIAELLTEWALGYPVTKSGGTGAMERGTGMEDEARSWYEMQRDVEVVRSGLVLRADGRVGGSPDGLVGDDGGVEIKCPLAHTHMLYLLGDDAPPYVAQTQGYIYLTGRAWWDVVSYSPVLPKVLVRVERDEAFQTALHSALDRFLAELDEGRDRLRALGVVPAPPFTRQTDPAAWEEAAREVPPSWLEDTLRASVEMATAGGSR